MGCAVSCPVCKRVLELYTETKFCQFCGSKLVYVGVDPVLLVRDYEMTVARRERLRKRFLGWAVLVFFAGGVIADRYSAPLGLWVILFSFAIAFYGGHLVNKRFPLSGGE